MRIAITSQKLRIPDTHEYFQVQHHAKITELEFRGALQVLSQCEYFAVDCRNRWVGIYVGFCLANNIPYVVIGLPKDAYFASYASFTKSEWRKFAGYLDDSEYTELHRSEAQDAIIEDSIYDRRTMGNIPM